MTQKITDKSGLVIHGAMLPYKPPIDKVAAMLVIQTHAKEQQVQINDIKFFKANERSEELLRRFEAAGLYPIDIGARKYHGQAGSATEYVVRDLNIPMTAGLATLIELLNHNNKTGSLKNQPFSIAHLVREFYELADDDAWQYEVLLAAAHVVEYFVEALDAKVRRTRSEELHPELKELAQKVQHSGDNPFTIGRYLKDMWVVGAPVEEIKQRVSWWITNREENKKLIKGGETAWMMLDYDKYTFMANQIKGIVLETDNRYLVRAAIKDKKYPLRLIKRSDGHMTISTANLPMQETAEYLMAREPGRWFYQSAMQAIINGGPQYVDVKPTEISTDEMVKILKDFALPHSKRQKYGKSDHHSGRHGDRRRNRSQGEAQYYS